MSEESFEKRVAEKVERMVLKEYADGIDAGILLGSLSCNELYIMTEKIENLENKDVIEAKMHVILLQKIDKLNKEKCE